MALGRGKRDVTAQPFIPTALSPKWPREQHNDTVQTSQWGKLTLIAALLHNSQALLARHVSAGSVAAINSIRQAHCSGCALNLRMKIFLFTFLINLEQSPLHAAATDGRPCWKRISY